MATAKPLKAGSTGIEQFAGSDTIPLAAVPVEDSIVAGSSGVQLDGDTASPGNSKLYGTNGSGVKGWYDQPTAGQETYTAGEAIAQWDLVYVSAAGTVMKADANAVAKRAVGFAPAAISNGASGVITFHDGKITSSGLTLGSYYFLSNTTTGAFALHSALTYGANDIQQCVGIAESTTTLRFWNGEAILVT